MSDHGWDAATINVVPEPPSFDDDMKDCRFDGTLEIGVPCCGILGSRPGFKAMHTTTISKNIYDLDDRHKPLLQSLLSDEPETAILHFGPEEGNLLNAKEIDSCQVPHGWAAMPTMVKHGLKKK